MREFVGKKPEAKLYLGPLMTLFSNNKTENRPTELKRLFNEAFITWAISRFVA